MTCAFASLRSALSSVTERERRESASNDVQGSTVSAHRFILHCASEHFRREVGEAITASARAVAAQQPNASRIPSKIRVPVPATTPTHVSSMLQFAYGVLDVRRRVKAKLEAAVASRRPKYTSLAPLLHRLLCVSSSLLLFFVFSARRFVRAFFTMVGFGAG
jgi:hypothetical protein